MYDEDDQSNDPNYIKGMVVFILALFEAIGSVFIPNIYFKRQNFVKAAVILGVMVLINCVTMGLMATTDQCPLDRMTNRYYISTGLYAVYTAWLLIAMILCIYTWYKRRLPKKRKDDPETHPIV